MVDVAGTPPDDLLSEVLPPGCLESPFFCTLHVALEYPDISVAVNTTRFCVLHPYGHCLYISVSVTFIVTVFTCGDRV